MRYISIPISILLCISVFTIFPCKAAPVWSDNFDSGNYNGWTVTNSKFEFNEIRTTSGTLTAEDHTLKSIGMVIAIHPSTTTTGTWSFDLLGMNEGSFDVDVMFINGEDTALGVHFYNDQWYPYAVSSGTGTQLANYPGIDMSTWTGWQHIDITRDSDGRICVYHDGTIVMDIPPSSLSTAVTTSTNFYLGFLGSGAIDNIVVSNTVDIQPPQLPFYRQTWFLATIGVVIVVAVVVTVFSLRRKK